MHAFRSPALAILLAWGLLASACAAVWLDPGLLAASPSLRAQAAPPPPRLYSIVDDGAVTITYQPAAGAMTVSGHYGHP